MISKPHLIADERNLSPSGRLILCLGEMANTVCCTAVDPTTEVHTSTKGGGKVFRASWLDSTRDLPHSEPVLCRTVPLEHDAQVIRGDTVLNSLSVFPMADGLPYPESNIPPENVFVRESERLVSTSSSKFYEPFRTT
ncbi:hypothetical protein AVEN_86623-1 [Araneus ventricosus]|uniref:Uncharacterized protein n=1 Tax=Araneus ventricosus TaxID=182803 RepID=A0A4Y2HVM5_ARAVE|nr:hypothetical protein AVEN_86623-1 [Araneus ventricosus]